MQRSHPATELPRHATISEIMRGTAWPVRLLLLLAILLPMALAAWFAWYQRTGMVSESKQTAERSVIALEEHAAKALQTQSLILNHIATTTQDLSWQQIENDASLQRTLYGLAQNFKQVALIGLADATGRLLVHSAAPTAESISIDDRDFFIAHKTGAVRDVFFSEPYVSPVNGIRQFALSIARTNAAGEFDGVIYAAVSLDYFTNFWKQFAPSSGYVIPLVRSDGRLMVRYPAKDNPDRLNPKGPFMQHIAHAPRNIYTAVSLIDGIERINAYSQIEGFPLYISYSVETDMVLQEWRRQVLPVMIMAAVIAAALAALWIALVRHSHYQRLSAVKWRTVAQDLDGEIKRRESAEEALRHAQKMEAIGQLTGGIAHDFNNHLAGVSGNLELMRIRLEQDRNFNIRPYIEAAASGADRAAKLTHRLLAFSRRQTLAPKSVDANELILSLGDLIRGTVGPSIGVSTVLDETLMHALCDPDQLENALLNLAINARDAMPNGGQLIISTANMQPDDATALSSYGELAVGWYVTIRVSDTGTGMSEEVLQRACDPFFTTKPIGQGTGLGLSIIHGFVKQSGGHMQIFSKEGKGTTVEILLPADPHRADGIRSSAEPAALPRASFGASILVVDDEVELRRVIIEMLALVGYKTCEAATAADALGVLKASGPVDLVISDIAMPGGMSGLQLVQAAREVVPGLKVLLMTGYTDDIIPNDFVFGESTQLLNKPFSMDALARKIAAMLEPGKPH